MTLDSLAQELIEESKKESDKILSKAREEADKIVSDAEDKAEQLIKSSESEVKNRLSSQEKERIAWANLEKKRIIAEAREHAVNNVLLSIRENLPKLRKSSAYRSFIKKAFTSALESIGSGAVVVHLVKGDKKYFSGFKKSRKIKFVDDLKASGGFILENREGNIRENYTLETMYELKKPLLRKKIYTSLFGA